MFLLLRYHLAVLFLQHLHSLLIDLESIIVSCALEVKVENNSLQVELLRGARNHLLILHRHLLLNCLSLSVLVLELLHHSRDLALVVPLDGSHSVL